MKQTILSRLNTRMNLILNRLESISINKKEMRMILLTNYLKSLSNKWNLIRLDYCRSQDKKLLHHPIKAKILKWGRLNKQKSQDSVLLVTISKTWSGMVHCLSRNLDRLLSCLRFHQRQIKGPRKSKNIAQLKEIWSVQNKHIKVTFRVNLM